MPFASIKEVYGDDFVVTTQQPFIYKSMLNNNEKYSPESIDQEVENFVSEYSNKLENYEDLENLYEEDFEEDKVMEGFSNQTNNDSDCGHLIEHLAKCPKCRLYLEKHFGGQGNAQKYINKKREDQLLDIAIYVATGIFILFLLDIFVRLGKFVG
jgi:hypothetical protein|tara:strand:+ start:2700 stop:3164 length:465 start_codon:yes stop_codon:yes gene_type:complete